MLFNLAGHVFDDSGIDTQRLGFSTSGSMPQGTVSGLEDLREFPATVSQNDALEQRARAGRLSMASFLVADMVKTRGQQRSSLQQIQGALVQDKTGSMRAAQATAQTEARFGGEIMKHNYLMQGQEQELTGMNLALSGVSSYI